MMSKVGVMVRTDLVVVYGTYLPIRHSACFLITTTATILLFLLRSYQHVVVLHTQMPGKHGTVRP